MFIEPQNKKDIWNPFFHKDFPGFASVAPSWELLLGRSMHAWPSIDDYNAFAKCSQLSISFTEQLNDMRYLWEIYHNAKVPTRVQSWHDFFNNLTWLVFPKLKGAIVDKMCQDPFDTKARSSIQNTLAHFDECGIIICSSQPNLFELLKNHQWQDFFCNKNVAKDCLPVIIGHGLMEKALKPYIGMTAKAVFLQVKPDFFALSTNDQNKIVDEKIAQFILSADFPTQPKALHPFPLLGWQGWYENQDDAFYSNKDYFRERRVNPSVPLCGLSIPSGDY